MYYLISFKRRKSPHPPNQWQMSEVKERLEGPKYNIDLVGGGGG